MSDTAERLKEILVDVLMLDDPSVIVPEAHLVNDLGAESINVAEIAVAIENEFGLAVPDEQLAQITTVGALTAQIDAARAAAGV